MLRRTQPGVHIEPMAYVDLLVGGKWRLGRRIGAGSFGDIYLGKFFNCTPASQADQLFCARKKNILFFFTAPLS